MRRILFVILAALLILSIFAAGCTRYRRYLAPIHDVEIWADNSSLPEYFADVVSGEPNSCVRFDNYTVTRAGNTIRVEILNIEYLGGSCAEIYSYVDHTIPLGSDFAFGVNYTVEVNDVTETFVAWV
jgi:hypothetical protein